MPSASAGAAQGKCEYHVQSQSVNAIMLFKGTPSIHHTGQRLTPVTANTQMS